MIEKAVLVMGNQDGISARSESVFGFWFEQSCTVLIDNMKVRCGKYS